MKKVDAKYRPIPFWSWNSELTEEGLTKQIEWMHSKGFGGFFMHARGGLTTPYLGEQWFKCVDASAKKAKELGMEPYAYDENGWPSGFVGGKLLEDIENHDRYLTYKIGEYDPESTVSYDISTPKLIKTNKGSNVLNVYMHYSFSTADVLNGEVVDKFIKLTHEEYKARDKYGIKGFFTDEPQFFRWATPYTKAIGELFKERYKEDIFEKIGLLFIEKEGYREFRYRYWKGMNELLCTNFGKKIYEWCEKNNYKFTGHYIEETTLAFQMSCCAGIMPLYEYQHIPGIDWLGRNIGNEISPKQLGSVASQLGKKQTLAEEFACAGWDVTPRELKHIAEYLSVNGVNLMCQHLLPFKENGQRKRDYPSHFSSVNPWVEDSMEEFNGYFSVLGEILSKSEDKCNVAIFHPIRSAYFNYKRELFDEGGAINEIESNFASICEWLASKGVHHHFIDETILAKHGKVEGNKLIVGNCAYDYIVFPLIYTMDKTSEAFLKEFINNGGKVLLSSNKPQYLEAEEYDYSYLKTNTTIEEIIASQDFKKEGGNDLRLTYRIDESGNPFIFIVNLGKEAQDTVISVKGYSSFKAYDILKDEYKIISNQLHFEQYESKILYFSNEKPNDEIHYPYIHIEGPYSIVEPVDNYLTIDELKYSFDGNRYSEKLPHMGILDLLIKQKYEGLLYLKYEFNIQEIPEECKMVIENHKRVKGVSINGIILNDYELIDDNEHRAYDIAKMIKEGNNEFIIFYDYWQSEKVYYALSDEATENLKNCLAFDSDIEPIYLKGKFGVSAAFKPGNNPNVYLGKNFIVVKQPKTIENLITDGFPFFAGNIHLRCNIEVDDPNKYIEFINRFHVLKVSINNKPYKHLMFDNKADVSEDLQKGINQVDIIFTASNHNLYGPFHTVEELDLAIGPYSFEKPGTWTNGKSSIYREEYAFIKTLF